MKVHQKFYLKNQPNNLVTVGPSESMSKSKKNTIDPNRIIEIYGADAVSCLLYTSPSPRDS